MSRLSFGLILVSGCVPTVVPGDSGAVDPPTSSTVVSGTMGLSCAEVGCAATDYCTSHWWPDSGPVVPELGNAECVALPAACATDATCACLLAQGTCVTCTDDAASGLPWCQD